MKTIFTQFLVLGFVSFAFFAKGQVFERTFQPTYTGKIFDIEPYHDGGWIILGENSEFLSRQYMIRLDNKGNVLWEKTAIPIVYSEHRQLSVLENGNIVVTGFEHACDVAYGPSGGQIDGNGNFLWKEFYNGFGINDSKVAGKQNGDLITISGLGLMQFDSTGQIVSQHPNMVFKEIDGLSNNQAIGIGLSNELVLIGANNNSVDSVTIPPAAKHLDAYQDTVSFIANEVIYVFDNQLNMIDNQSFVGQFDEIIDFIYRYDGYQLLVKNQGISYLKCFDLNGNLTQNISLGNDKFVGITLNRFNNILAIGGYYEANLVNNDDFQNLAFNTMFIKTFQLNEPVIDEFIDIELLKIEADSLHIQPANCWFSNTANYKTYWDNLRVLVKNNGTNPLQSFQLHGLQKSHCLQSCVSGSLSVRQEVYLNQSLQPGDSAYFVFPSWEAYGQENTANHEICFWATVPNFKMDDNLDNNLACLTMIATNSNEVLTAQTHRIFPNPTDGFINIEFENLTKIETIKVINQIGQIVDNQIINKEISNYKMDISHLPKGIYFMEIWTENGRQIGKVIKH